MNLAIYRIKHLKCQLYNLKVLKRNFSYSSQKEKCLSFIRQISKNYKIFFQIKIFISFHYFSHKPQNSREFPFDKVIEFIIGSKVSANLAFVCYFRTVLMALLQVRGFKNFSTTRLFGHPHSLKIRTVTTGLVVYRPCCSVNVYPPTSMKT